MHARTPTQPTTTRQTAELTAAITTNPLASSHESRIFRLCVPRAVARARRCAVQDARRAPALVLLEHFVPDTCTSHEVGLATIDPSFLTFTNEWLLQLNLSSTLDRQERACLPGVMTMSQSTESYPMDSYYTLEEITETWRRFNRGRTEWTLQQHEEWRTFLYYQCLARDRRYERNSPSECLRDTISTSFSWSFVFCAILVFHDNIFDCAVWSRDYIYEFICPDCSIRGIALIMMGALSGLVWLVLSSSVLLWTIWRYKRWLPFALALLWMAGCLLDGVQQLYEAWSGYHVLESG
jgi:hypothetical protein